MNEVESADESDASTSNSAQELDKLNSVSKFMASLRAQNTSLGLELMCGVTVALALVPEAVAFALSAGLTPSIGLHSAWIIALFTAVLGGRPAMICGATGSLCVLVGDTVNERGVEYLFVAVVVMGVIEIALGLLRVGALVKLIPTPVMIGFCNGLALVIGLAQFNNFKDVSSHKAALKAEMQAEGRRRLGSFDAFTDGQPFISGAEGAWAGVIAAVSFFVCLLLPRLTKKVPSALVAIAAGTAIEWGLARAVSGTGTPTVDDIAGLHGSFPSVAWLDKAYTMPPLNLETLHAVLPLSITMSAVGLLESLMTLNLVDELTDTQGSTMRECIGQGVANIVCGVLGGMGGCAMIGQSMINIGSGARTRVSSAMAGIVLLFIVMVAYPAINIIPVSALVGVMFNVVFHTFEWKSLNLMFLAALPSAVRENCFSEQRSKQKIRRTDALVILVVTIVTLLTDLAIAVATGMAVSCLMFVFDTASKISVSTRHGVDPDTGDPIKYYDVHGILFFGSCTQFLSLFDEKHDPVDVRLVFDAGYIADYSAIEALNKLGERYGAFGKRVKLQQLKPGCGRLVQKSAGLLVKELDVSLESEEVLSAKREHLNVENWIEDHDHGQMSRRASEGSDAGRSEEENQHGFMRVGSPR